MTVNPLSGQMIEPQHPLAVLRVLDACGPMQADDVKAALLRAEAGERARKRVDESLEFLKQIGLAREEGGTCIAHIPDQERLYGSDEFRAHILSWLAKLPLNQILDEPSGFFRIVRVAAFLLQSNPLKGPHSWDEATRLAGKVGQDQDKIIIPNDTQWPGFLAWAPFLGMLGASRGNRVWVDPSFAIDCALRSIAIERTVSQVVLSVPEFEQEMHSRLPWLPGGAVPGALAENLKMAVVGDGRDTVSFALLRLARLGRIVLGFPQRADVKSPTKRIRLLDGREAVSVTWGAA